MEPSDVGALNEVRMSATRDPRSASAGSNYTYRRRLRGWDLLPAIGIGVGVGLAAFYVMSLMLQRTPLSDGRRRKSERRRRTTIVREARG